jgi:hypothetical protein
LNEAQNISAQMMAQLQMGGNMMEGAPQGGNMQGGMPGFNGGAPMYK